MEAKIITDDCVKFNLNDHILVKLKEGGLNHWMAEYNYYLPHDLKKPLSYFQSKVNAEGYVEFQAWEFFQMFAKTIVFGDFPIFDTTIKINKNELD